jgi:hypothetical protein
MHNVSEERQAGPARVRTDLGRRVELVSMDPRFERISIGLYVGSGADGPVARLHTYSTKPGAGERLETLAHVIARLGGMEQADEDPLELHFPCGAWHGAAARRLFTEACKLDPAAGVETRPLTGTDSRSGQAIEVEPLGAGRYRVTATGAGEGTASRAPAIARAIAKLAELDVDADDETVVAFPCRHDHDALIGLLLVRAQNLRAILREEELQATRGVLSAPSAQDS